MSMELCVLGPLPGRSFAIARKPNLLLLRPTTPPLLRISLPLSLSHLSSSSSSPRLTSPIVFAAQESNLSVSNESETSEWVMQDFYTLRKDVEIASARVEEIRDSAGLQQLEQEIANLESKATDTSFWDDRSKAQETLSALNDLKDRMRLLSDFKSMVMFGLLLMVYISKFMFMIFIIADFEIIDKMRWCSGYKVSVRWGFWRKVS
ncbi:PREDICTED: peptide chain release factor PrfB1, chloroplastic-like [Camelina sativa]|uniref:Peptide chain release factor PrfB1, chloroplastic-like n=1 Tax=Camelina sativa TaxID=90675 RepID=A0ABM1QL22_CAMSA|nr:PREDICTED: peptide chain release factor PrfB1, chloroplastic-like [Camelina sativa]